MSLVIDQVVYHPTFGEGTVEQVVGPLITVHFNARRRTIYVDGEQYNRLTLAPQANWDDVDEMA